MASRRRFSTFRTRSARRDRGALDLIPNIGATIAGVIIAGISLSVSLEATIAFVMVTVVYQQIENYVLQPTIIGKATHVAGFGVIASVLAFGALFGFIGAIIAVPIAAGLQISSRNSPRVGEVVSGRPRPGSTDQPHRRRRACGHTPPRVKQSSLGDAVAPFDRDSAIGAAVRGRWPMGAPLPGFPGWR